MSAFLMLLAASGPQIVTATARSTILHPVVIRAGQPPSAFPGTVIVRRCDAARTAACRVIIYEHP